MPRLRPTGSLAPRSLSSKIVGCVLTSTAKSTLHRSNSHSGSDSGRRSEVAGTKKRVWLFRVTRSEAELAEKNRSADLSGEAAGRSSRSARLHEVACKRLTITLALLAIQASMGGAGVAEATSPHRVTRTASASEISGSENAAEEVQWRYTAEGWQHVDDLRAAQGKLWKESENALHPMLFAALLMLVTLWVIVAFSPAHMWEPALATGSSLPPHGLTEAIDS